MQVDAQPGTSAELDPDTLVSWRAAAIQVYTDTDLAPLHHFRVAEQTPLLCSGMPGSGPIRDCHFA